jgi:hypothetical protein
MSAYVHHCEKCGAQMQVHDRYAGRTLKCTTCRTEFVAGGPEGGAEVDTYVPASARQAPEKSGRRFLPLLLLLIPLAGFLFWMSGDDDSTPDTAFREGHAVGDIASVDTGTTRPVLVALDHESVGALVDMRTGAIQIGVSSLMTNQDKYLELEAGTRVRVLAYANEDREAKVRILDGPSANQDVWVPRRWLR